MNGRTVTSLLPKKRYINKKFSKRGLLIISCILCVGALSLFML